MQEKGINRWSGPKDGGNWHWIEVDGIEFCIKYDLANYVFWDYKKYLNIMVNFSFSN